MNENNNCQFAPLLHQILSKLDEQHQTTKEISRRLFVDNGKPSMQTDIDRLKMAHKRNETALAWFTGIGGGALAIVLADMISRHVK